MRTAEKKHRKVCTDTQRSHRDAQAALRAKISKQGFGSRPDSNPAGTTF